MEKLKAVIYLRVSDESQIKNNSLETQLKSCKIYAEANNLDVVRVFREEGVSAKHVQNRPEMLALLKFSIDKKNKINSVIIYKMDRWTRNVEEGLLAISLLAKHGVNIAPATEVAEQNSMGKAMRTILMALGELDNGLKSERTRDNMQTMFRKGLWPWKPTIGYIRPKGDQDFRKGKPATFNDKLVEQIKLLFIKASEAKYSKKVLADYLNSLGFEKEYGKSANGKLITHILKNPFYYGMMYASKWKEYAQGLHEPLVKQDVWEAANMNTFGRKRKYNVQDSTIYPLKELLLCNSCHHALTSSNPLGRSKNYLYYECHNKTCKNKERIDVEGAHKQFLATMAKLKPSKVALKLFSTLVFDEWDEALSVIKKEVAIREEKINELDAEIIATSVSNRKGILTDDEARNHTEKLRAELLVVKVEKTEMKIDEYDTEAVKSFTENFLTNLDRFWMQLELPEKQMLQKHIFPDGILCEDYKIRINSLARSFKLIDALDDPNCNLVTQPHFLSNHF